MLEEFYYRLIGLQYLTVGTWSNLTFNTTTTRATTAVPGLAVNDSYSHMRAKRS